MNASLNRMDSPFHRGEQAVQKRLGVRDKIEIFARRVVRDHLPDQHRDFYGELPFVVLGTVDDRGRPWASLVPGRPGFMTSKDARRLDVAVRPLAGDPLNTTLQPGADVGILGIQLETRRRNRLTGRIATTGDDGFAIAVDQAFGNCPQYIQTRAVEILPEIDSPGTARPIARLDRFDARTTEMITQADTLFIATATADGPDAQPRDPTLGADVSHRGGKPGFVTIEDDRTFVFPDFSGNNHFNTIGNIVLNPKAGFLFADFESGDVAYLTGAAEIVWEGEEVNAFAGAERLIRFTAEEVVRVEGSLPLRFAFGEYSPVLEHTGSWAEVADAIAENKQRGVYTPFEVVDIQAESEVISSFYLRRTDGHGLATYEAGQFLPIRLQIPGQEGPVLRTYTLSDAPGGEHYRLSIKREGGEALVSTYAHDHLKLGDTIEAMAPRGKFVLDCSSNRPVVLLSGGVGITPMIAMTNALINEGLRTGHFRPIYFIHGAQNGAVHAFGDHIRELAEAHEQLTAHIRYSHPGAQDRLGETHHSEGFVDMELLKEVLPFDDYDFYLCGPAPFMQAIYDGLTGIGVRDERIHYESFGPATLLKHDAEPEHPPAKGQSVDGPVRVSFADADIEATWSPDKGTLLELAEAAGVNPDFACRSGVCGTCATRIKCGTVDYIEEPSAAHADDEVLICCATPRSTAGAASCGEDHSVVLAL